MDFSDITAADPTAQFALKRVGERTALAMPLELEEGAPPQYFQLAIYVVTGLMVALLVWANLATVRQLSIADGKIVPYGAIHPVSHFSGGVVSELFVREGDIVEAGAPLVRLRNETEGGDLEKFETRQANLQIIVERLTAQIEERQPDFSALDARWTVLTAEQYSAFEAALSKQNSLLDIIDEGREIAKSQLLLAHSALEAKQEQDLLLAQLFEIQEKLLETGNTSKAKYLDAKATYSMARADAAAAASQLEQARRSLNRLNAEYDAAIINYKDEATQQRANLVAELKELEQPLIALAYIDENLTVRSPIKGMIKSINVAGKLAVLGSGETIAEIVPIDETLIAEIRINPQDIGHLFVSQRAEIIVTTFDPNRFGKIDGEVSYLSPDSFTDDMDGSRYFSGRIEFDSSTIGEGKHMREISAGMVVRAEIITRRRSLMEYMLKPIARSLDSSFSEQ